MADVDIPEDWLEAWLEACDERAVVDGRMIPEMVVAMLKAFDGSMAGRLVRVMMPGMVVAMLKALEGSMAGRLVAVGITSPVCAK